MAFKITTNHDEIREWIKTHRGTPAVYKEGDNVDSVLRIKFNDKNIGYQEIGWQEFFDRFDTLGLVFSYNDHVIRGDEELSFNFQNKDVVAGQTDNPNELPDAHDDVDENMFPSQPAH
jgi:hypothetical protein